MIDLSIETMSKLCLGCSNEIPPKRVEILPNTKFCVSCAEGKVGKKRGISYQGGTGEDTYTNTVIMEEQDYINYVIHESVNSSKKKVNKAEFLDFDTEDSKFDNLKFDDSEE